MALNLATSLAAAMAAGMATDLGSGAILEIRTGGAPGANNAATGTLLCSITIAGSFTPSSNSISAGDPASQLPVAAGTAGHFRLKTSGGTAKLEGTISALAGAGDLKLTDVNIVMGVPVDVGVPTFTVPIS